LDASTRVEQWMEDMDKDLGNGCVTMRIFDEPETAGDYEQAPGQNPEMPVSIDQQPYYLSPKIVTAKQRTECTTIGQLIMAHCMPNLIQNIKAFLKTLDLSILNFPLSASTKINIWTTACLYHEPLPFKPVELPKIDKIWAFPARIDSIQCIHHVAHFDTVLVLTNPGKEGIHRLKFASINEETLLTHDINIFMSQPLKRVNKVNMPSTGSMPFHEVVEGLLPTGGVFGGQANMSLKLVAGGGSSSEISLSPTCCSGQSCASSKATSLFSPSMHGSYLSPSRPTQMPLKLFSPNAPLQPLGKDKDHTTSLEWPSTSQSDYRSTARSDHSSFLHPSSSEQNLNLKLKEKEDALAHHLSVTLGRCASDLIAFFESGRQKAASNAAKSVGSVSPSKLSIGLPTHTFVSGSGSGSRSGSYTGSGASPILLSTFNF
ncbi:hypothetical protein FRC11_012198, partial [Ceratobasidium sp. 423]